METIKPSKSLLDAIDREIEYSLFIHPETIPVAGNCSAIDDETDKATEEEIYDRLSCGDLWAWCCVEVKAEFRGLTSSDYLGGCCYKDEDEFTQPEGYYDDMKGVVYDDIASQAHGIASL